MTNYSLERESKHMPTSAALKVARGRAAQIIALETAYTDDPVERDEQAKYDLAVEFRKRALEGAWRILRGSRTL